MKITIIGVGAIGGYVFAKLSEAGEHDIQCVTSPTSALLKQQSIQLSSDNQSLTYPIKQIASDYAQIDGDIIFITTKTTQNSTVFPRLSSLKNKTFIVIQNGIGNEQHLAKYLHQSNTIIGATTNIKVTKKHTDNKVTLHNPLCQFNYALFQQGAVTAELGALFNQIFTSVTHTEDIYQARFPKLLVNLSCNLASILYDACMQTLSTSKEPRHLIEQIGKEVIQVAQAYQVDIAPSRIDLLLNKLAEPGFKGVYFSMKEDFDAGRPLETETVFDNFITLADQAAIATPVTRSALNQLYIKLEERQLSKV
ncbi:2-dehydropantoate 2-reductase [Vibrio sp. S4M6]|uniref:ketopantoate reductase family protein n=1 Tax=Vibrio sinus TaxID=2946865 RepID=UPI00202A0015|nr:2-dehydropantoate 2-reductase [Vibrio sinus]MCL9780785.1 2-dehydropantoate 2-reductase [Vibrio sinus]